MDREQRRSNRDGSIAPVVVRKPLAAQGTGLLFLVISICLGWAALSGTMPLFPGIFVVPLAMIQFAAATFVLRCKVTISPKGVVIRNYRTTNYPLDQFNGFEEVVRSPVGDKGRNPTKVIARTDTGEILAWALSFEYASGDRSIADGRDLLRELNEEVERLRTKA